MLKITTLLIAMGLSIITTSQIANAQTNKSSWTFGAKAGINLANTSNKDESGRTGFNVGGTVEYKLSNHFFLQSGLEFTTKGSKMKDQLISFSIPYFNTDDLTQIGYEDNIIFTGKLKGSQNLRFLQIPVTIGYRLPVAENINLTFNIGGYAAYGISACTSYKLKGILEYPDGKRTSFNHETKQKKYNETGLERFDYGLLGGIGIEYKKFSFNANYEFGLRDLDKNSEINGNILSYKISKWKNRNLSLLVGYKF